IYRVRRTGAPRIEDPRGLKLAWSKLEPKELAELMGDPRPAVRRRAINIAGQKNEAVAALIPVLQSPLVAARLGAVWALTRNQQPRARQAVRQALADADETVRQAALNSI